MTSSASSVVLATPRIHSEFLAQLRGAFASAMVPEMDLTLKVAVMSAAQLTRAEILRELQRVQPDADELDVKMAFLRLRRVAGAWHA